MLTNYFRCHKHNNTPSFFQEEKDLPKLKNCQICNVPKGLKAFIHVYISVHLTQKGKAFFSLKLYYRKS